MKSKLINTKNNKKEIFFLSFCILFITSLNANDISDLYGQTIELASGYEQLIKESPSAVSVITSEDIKRIGAITIEEILETIPGIHVSYENGFFPVYIIRGVGTTTNTPVLIYLDGIPINNSVTSSSYFSLSHLTNDIDRIEIIKGPGSAIYGADAFSGVINIITKKIRGTEIGTITGSFDTYGGWINHGYKSNDFNLSFSAQGLSTKGSNRTIETDRQTLIDNAFGTNASLAPGSINRGREDIDIKLSAQYLNSKIYLRYVHKDTQNGTGNAILDNSGFIKSDSWITSFNHTFGPQDWKTKIEVNYTGYIFDLNANIFPSGTFGGLFNTPVINEAGYTAHDFSTRISTVFKKIDNHIVHSGIGYEYDVAGNIKDKRNFIEGPGNILLPTGSLQNTSDLGVQPFSNENSRYVVYGFIQDEWKFLNDFSLTAGVRVDYFSDFGFTANPRVSLIWDASSSITTKIMYGRAFRAPSFFELYTNSSLLVTGNKNLKPETIQTVEWFIHKIWPHRINTQLGLFWYETNQLISDTTIIDRLNTSESRVFVNSSGVNTYGIEFEFKYKILDNLELDMNYTYLSQEPENRLNDKFIIAVPNHQVYAAINWEFIPKWTTNIRSTSVIGRNRSSTDLRPQIKDYTKVDFTLRGENIIGNLDITFKINNVFDANIREPSVDGISLPNDYPIDNRLFIGILSYKF